MSASAYISLFNSFVLIVMSALFGKLWIAMREFKQSLDALTDELIEQGVLPPKKLNGKSRHRREHA